MSINKIKNFVIFALVITAVYQTGMLWLEGTTSHNFFYTVFGSADKNKNIISGERNVLLPTRFAVGTGNKKFSVYYPESQNGKAILMQSNEFLTEVLEDGTLTKTSETTDWETILQSRCVVFQYPFTLPVDDAANSFSKLRKVQDMGYYDCLALLPAKYNGEVSKVYLLNTETGACASVKTEKSKFATELYDMLETMEDTLIYVSTEQSGFKLFHKNIFVPQWTEQSWKYPSLKQVNPFEVDGVVNRTVLENSVNGFFKNLAADWASSDAYVFSDESIVVKYQPEGTLEYYSYDSNNTDKNLSIADGYRLCRNFMKNDKSLQTNVFLSNVRVRSNETIYYFDYEVNGFPVILSEELRRHIAMEHAIEIVVRNNSVRTYKRYAYNFVESGEKESTVDVDFLTALNQAIMNYQKMENYHVVTDVDDIYLGYMAERSESVKLKWFVEMYGYLFQEETEGTDMNTEPE